MLDEDDELDALKTQIFRELLTYMLQDPATIEPALDLILISRHLERIGDHATNIAEDVIFIVSAKDVRHHATSPGPDERRADPRPAHHRHPWCVMGAPRSGRAARSARGLQWTGCSRVAGHARRPRPGTLGTLALWHC